MKTKELLGVLTRFKTEAGSFFLNRGTATAINLLGLSKIKKYEKEYRLMQADLKKAEKSFKPSNLWQIINVEFRDIMTIHGVENFKDHYTYRHFSAYSPDNPRIFEAMVWQYYQNIQKRDVLGLLKKIEEPEIGGRGDIVMINGKRLSFDLLQSIDEFYSIYETSAINENTENIIMELGSGYGRLAFVFLKALPNSHYVILDLPESLLLAQFYLSNAFPKISMSTYEQTREIKNVSRNVLKKKRLWFFGAMKFPEFENNATDVFVNIYSLQEMEKQQLKNYLRIASEKTAKVVYLKQHFIENNPINNEKILEKYYRLPDGWKIIYSRTSNTYLHCFEKAFRKM